MTPENEKYYKDTKKTTEEFLDDFHEFLEIISEFKTNPYLRDLHQNVVSETCKRYLKAPESLYVLTIRRLVNMVKSLTLITNEDNTHQAMLHYKSLYEETWEELEKTKKDLEDISKIINRGDTVE